MLQEVQATLTWCIPNFRRQTNKIVSPTFGPASCTWELSLYPEGHGTTRDTHMGLFLDVVKTEAETSLGDQWTRPILNFRLSVMKKGTREAVVVKEREPAGQEGFGRGFTHPRSWGWAALLPLSRLSEAVDGNGTMTVCAEVTWMGRAELVKLLERGRDQAREGSLLFKWVLADVRFAVRKRQLSDSRGMDRHGGCSRQPGDHTGNGSLFDVPHDDDDGDENDDDDEDLMSSPADDASASSPPTRRPLSTASSTSSVSLPCLTISTTTSPSTTKPRTLTPPAHTRTDHPSSLDAPTTPIDDLHYDIIPAHRAILASRSDYFTGMFTSGLLESSTSNSFNSSTSSPSHNTNNTNNLPTILIHDFDPLTIRCMLQFLYTSTIPPPTTTQTSSRIPFSTLCQLIRLADLYILPSLHVHVTALLLEHDLSHSTILQLLELGDTYSNVSTGLKRACLGYVREHLKELRGMEEWRAWVASGRAGRVLVEVFDVL
ncbi:hypothetical protein BC832DRAFT_551203 [Gaertneriomyces semiglobifer]|nr:hypothetical protein BC832DRAFT_551203 [Gaertneriomyces semiglobifer]